MVVFSPIFVADAKIIFWYDFAAPLTYHDTDNDTYTDTDSYDTYMSILNHIINSD